MKKNKLEQKITDIGMKRKYFAEKLGISQSYLPIKLKKTNQFTVEEINKTAKILDLSVEEIIEIFEIKKS